MKCPDEIIPKMSSVAPPSPELNAILNQLCHNIFGKEFAALIKSS